jgi:hypothetical protein
MAAPGKEHMANAHMLPIDLAQRSFQVCALGQAGTVLYNRTISRSKVETLLKEHPCFIVAMEACATSHFWGRFAGAEGHDVRLIPPIYVKPFVKRQKNDAADAAAMAEAAVRPNLHFVAVKSAEHQARAVAYRTHQCFVSQRTQTINALRGHLAEFGLIFPQGVPHLKEIRAAMDDEDVDVPPSIREIAGLYLEHIDTLSAKIDELSLRLREAMAVSAELRRLCTVPGVCTRSADVRQRQELCGVARPGAEAAINGRKIPPRAHEQNGSKRHLKTSRRRCDEQGTMDCAQRRSPRQLAGPHDGSPAQDGGRRSTGEQNGADNLGDDDPRGRLPFGVMV